MEFHEYTSMYQMYKKSFKDIDGCRLDTPEKFYRWMFEGNYNRTSAAIAAGLKPPERATTYNTQTITELQWYRRDRMYYAIHPELIPVFSRHRMDIPCDLLNFPNNSNTFCIRLPKENNPFILDENHRVQSILCWRMDDKEVAKLGRQFHQLRVVPLGDRRITLWIDINETDQELGHRGMSWPVLTYRILSWKEPTETIESALHNLPISESALLGVQMPDEMIRDCIRLMCSVCFLTSSNDPIVVPDVLVKDRLKYWLSNDPQVWHDLHQRARDRGKYGWLVGIDEMFSDTPLPGAVQPVERGTGKPLQFAHYRQSHWHLVHYGPGKSQSKVVLYKQTLVGKGLPFKKETVTCSYWGKGLSLYYP